MNTILNAALLLSLPESDFCTHEVTVNARMVYIKLYRVLWWHRWTTGDRQRESLVFWGRRKWAHRKCSHTEAPCACTASLTAPPVDSGRWAPTKPHPGLHQCSAEETETKTINNTGRELRGNPNDLERGQLKETWHNIAYKAEIRWYLSLL